MGDRTHVSLTPLRWENQADYSKRYLARKLLQPKE